jgi:hypothetical protein
VGLWLAPPLDRTLRYRAVPPARISLKHINRQINENAMISLNYTFINLFL